MTERKTTEESKEEAAPEQQILNAPAAAAQTTIESTPQSEEWDDTLHGAPQYIRLEPERLLEFIEDKPILDTRIGRWLLGKSSERESENDSKSTTILSTATRRLKAMAPCHFSFLTSLSIVACCSLLLATYINGVYITEEDISLGDIPAWCIGYHRSDVRFCFSALFIWICTMFLLERKRPIENSENFHKISPKIFVFPPSFHLFIPPDAKKNFKKFSKISSCYGSIENF